MSLRIVSGGELVYEPWPWMGDWYAFRDIGPDYSHFAENTSDDLVDPLNIWRTQRAVRTVVGFLARNFAQVKMHGYRTGVDQDRERLARSHPLERLLQNPAPGQTSYEAARNVIVDVCLYDRWAALKVADGDGGVTLRRVPPRRWRFVRDTADQPVGIRLWLPEQTRQPGGPEHVDVDLDVFVWLDGYPHPGESPMRYLRDLLEEERESSRSRRAMWKRGARISGWIERPVEAPPWGRTARERFGRRWRESYRADGEHEGGTPLLEDGMKFHDASVVTPRQAEQITARKLSMSEVAAAFFVAPVLVGVLDNANYSNVKEFREQLYSDTLGPWFAQVGQAWNARLVPDLVADPDDVYVEHNVAEKLRMSFEEQAKVLQSAVGGPYMTRNEGRQRINLPNLDGADDLIVPLNVLVGGQASPTDSRPDLTGRTS